MLQSISSIFKAKIVQPPVASDNGEFILSKDQFLVFQAAFKRQAQAKQITAGDIVLYNILRNKPIDNGFTRITNKIKLFNGQHPKLGYFQAEKELRYNLNWTTQTLLQKFDNFIPFKPVSGNKTIRELNPIINKIYERTN